MTTDIDLGMDALRAVSDPLRWRILNLLAGEELCVCHLVDALEVPQPLVSHHLKVLRIAGLVDTDRFRYWTYYRLRPDALASVGRQLLELSEGVPAVGQARRPCC